MVSLNLTMVTTILHNTNIEPCTLCRDRANKILWFNVCVGLTLPHLPTSHLGGDESPQIHMQVFMRYRSNEWDMDDFLHGLGEESPHESLRVVMTLVHPNDNEFTTDGRAYGYQWMTCRIGAQLGIEYSSGIKTSVEFSRDLDTDLIEVDGIPDSLAARNLIEMAMTAYYDALMDWHEHVERYRGITPNGRTMFLEADDATHK